MRLIAIGHLTDRAVPFAYDAIKAATNQIESELADDLYLEPNEIIEFIGLASSERIIFVAHGCANSVLSASAPQRRCFDDSHVRALKNRYVFANCCSTAKSLGQIASAYAYLYIGFADTVAVPPSKADVGAQSFIEIYSFILSFLSEVKYSRIEQIKGEVHDFLENLFVRVEDVLALYDQSGATSLSADTMLFARDLQFELTAWIRGCEKPLVCAAASKRSGLY